MSYNLIPRILVTAILIFFIIDINIYKKASVELIYKQDNNYVYQIKKPLEEEVLCLSFSKKIRIKQGCIFTKNSERLFYNYIKGMLSSLYFKPNPKNKPNKQPWRF